MFNHFWSLTNTSRQTRNAKLIMVSHKFLKDYFSNLKSENDKTTKKRYTHFLVNHFGAWPKTIYKPHLVKQEAPSPFLFRMSSQSLI